jgi:hypothetical protein
MSIYYDSIINAPTNVGTITNSLQTLTTKIAEHDNRLTINDAKLQQVAGGQNAAYTISQIEQTRLNAKQQNIDQALQGQNRMIALNDSYVKKYSKYNQIIMVIVLIILLVLGAILLPTYVPAIPSAISDIIIVLAIGVGIIIVYVLYADIQKRDSLYFDKLNIPAPNTKDISSNLMDKSLNTNQAWDLNGACIGPDCCNLPAQYINGKCVNPPSDIYDYQTKTYKTCNGAMGCTPPNPADYKQTWRFDVDSARWVNDFTNKYWNLDSTPPGAADIPPISQGFTNMVGPMDRTETDDYSYYK